MKNPISSASSFSLPTTTSSILQGSIPNQASQEHLKKKRKLFQIEHSNPLSKNVKITSSVALVDDEMKLAIQSLFEENCIYKHTQGSIAIKKAQHILELYNSRNFSLLTEEIENLFSILRYKKHFPSNFSIKFFFNCLKNPHLQEIRNLIIPHLIGLFDEEIIDYVWECLEITTKDIKPEDFAKAFKIKNNYFVTKTLLAFCLEEDASRYFFCKLIHGHREVFPLLEKIDVYRKLPSKVKITPSDIGIDPNIIYSDGLLPIHAAAADRNINALSFFFKYLSAEEFFIKTPLGKSCLHFFFSGPFTYEEEEIQLLDDILSSEKFSKEKHVDVSLLQIFVQSLCFTSCIHSWHEYTYLYLRMKPDGLSPVNSSYFAQLLSSAISYEDSRFSFYCIYEMGFIEKSPYDSYILPEDYSDYFCEELPLTYETITKRNDLNEVLVGYFTETTANYSINTTFKQIDKDISFSLSLYLMQTEDCDFLQTLGASIYPEIPILNPHDLFRDIEKVSFSQRAKAIGKSLREIHHYLDQGNTITPYTESSFETGVKTIFHNLRYYYPYLLAYTELLQKDSANHQENLAKSINNLKSILFNLSSNFLLTPNIIGKDIEAQAIEAEEAIQAKEELSLIQRDPSNATLSCIEAKTTKWEDMGANFYYMHSKREDLKNSLFRQASKQSFTDVQISFP